MHGFVNKKNVETSKVSFKHCIDYVDHNYKPQLLSRMVDEFTKTGQLPNSTPLRPLATQTDDIESIALERTGADKIDDFQVMQSIMDNIDGLESQRATKMKAYQEAVEKDKNAKRQKLLDDLKNLDKPE